MGFGTRLLIVSLIFLALFLGGEIAREGTVTLDNGGTWWVQVLVFLIFAFFAFAIATKWDDWAKPTKGLTTTESGPPCFCGCGMFVADWTGQQSNELGWLMNMEFSSWVKILSVGGMISPKMEAGHESPFIQDGWDHWKELRKQTHLGYWPERELKKEVKRWLDFSESAAEDLRSNAIFSAMSFDSLPDCSPSEIEAWVEDGTQPGWLVSLYGE